MWIIHILLSRCLPPITKFWLLKIKFKYSIFTHFNLKYKLTEHEIFQLDYTNDLEINNDCLLSENKQEYLANYNIPNLGIIFLFIRKTFSSDFEVFKQIFRKFEYKALVDYVLCETEAKTIKYILDAGANVAYTTIFLNKYFPEAEFICIEPEKGNFIQLNRNIKINKLENVETIQAGLWNCEEDLEITNNFRDKKEWSYQLKSNDKKDLVKGYTVRRIMDIYGWNHIDIFKIDIEGAERFLFMDKPTVEKFLPFVKFIAIEIHDEYNFREQIYLMLKEFNFIFFNDREITIAMNTSFKRTNIITQI